MPAVVRPETDALLSTERLGGGGGGLLYPLLTCSWQVAGCCRGTGGPQDTLSPPDSDRRTGSADSRRSRPEPDRTAAAGPGWGGGGVITQEVVPCSTSAACGGRLHAGRGEGSYLPEPFVSIRVTEPDTDRTRERRNLPPRSARHPDLTTDVLVGLFLHTSVGIKIVFFDFFF